MFFHFGAVILVIRMITQAGRMIKLYHPDHPSLMHRPVQERHIHPPETDKSEGSSKGIIGKLLKVHTYLEFADFSLYGSWEALDSLKRFMFDVGTVLDTARCILRIF